MNIGPEIIIAAIIIGMSLPSGCSSAINNLAEAVREVAKAIREHGKKNP
jgi:outer membrane murein-binding lipoprotein Lpp